MNEYLCRFLESLSELSATTLRASAAAIRRCHGDVTGDDVLWWNATMAIDDTLRDEAHVVEAAAAAQQVAVAVAEAARMSGLNPSDDPDVAVLTRRAQEVARGIVAGEGAADATAWLLSCWGDHIDFALPFDPPKPLDPD